MLLVALRNSHALEDCTPDLRRGPIAVCAGARGAECGVAFRCGGLFPLFPVVHVCRVVLLRSGSWKAQGSPVADVSLGLVCQGLAPFDGGDPDALVLRDLVCPPKDEVHDGLVGTFLSAGKVPVGLGGELCPAFL